MDYTKLPIILIGNYIWGKASGAISGSTKLPTSVWNTDAYTITPPIFAVNDSNAITNVTPYILYDYLFTGIDAKMFPMIREEATLSIVAPWNELYPIKNFIYDILSQFDDSADAVNNYVNDSGIRFKYIKVRQDNYSLNEKQQISLQSGLYISTLYLTYEYTRV